MSRLLPRLPATLACVTALGLPAVVFAAGSNLLVNPDFDTPADPPWHVTPAGTFDMTHDADSCLQSGALVMATGLGATLTVDQCVNVPSSTVFYTGQLRAQKTFGPGEVTGVVAFDIFTGPDCAGSPLSGSFSFDTAVTSEWVAIRTGGLGGASIRSMKFRASFDSTGILFGVRVDRAFLGLSADIFAEDQEVGELCRYSDSFPP